MDENQRVTLTGFGSDRVNRTASFSAMLMNGQGSIHLNVQVPADGSKKDTDPEKTAIKAALKEQFDLLVAAIDSL